MRGVEGELSHLVSLDEGEVHGLGDELADGALPTASRARDDEEVVVLVLGGAIGGRGGGKMVCGWWCGLHHGRAVLVGEHRCGKWIRGGRERERESTTRSKSQLQRWDGHTTGPTVQRHPVAREKMDWRRVLSI